MNIEKIKKVGKKYKILLENGDEIKTYDDVIINYGLLYKKGIDNDLLNKITIDNNYYDIYYKTVNYITKKLRSEKEINSYIDKNNPNNADKEKIINKLKQINLINDTNFVKAYIADKINLSNEGPNKIYKSLLEHNIKEELILSELNKIDDCIISDKLTKIIAKRVKNTKYSGYKLKYKILSELVNLGYDKTLILEKLENINIDQDINKEADKIYRNLSKKYQGETLIYKLKTKLYNKGFQLDEINNYIDKISI